MDTQSTTTPAVLAWKVYDAFGNETSSAGTFLGPFGYGGGFGYQEEATGLKLLGHRLYDSSTGRFLTRDPIKDGRNWYVYCEGDSVNFVDHTGNRPTWVYRLFKDGRFLKNGISRNLGRRMGQHRRRFGKGIHHEVDSVFDDSIPLKEKNGPYNKQALARERQMNMENPGPENHERYIDRGPWAVFLELAIDFGDPISAGENLGPAIDPYVGQSNRDLANYRINRWLGEDDEYTTEV